MESWKIVISGTEGVAEESLKDALQTNDVEDLIDRCGAVAYSIKGYIKDRNLLICDMGAGRDGWDISVRCSEKNSRLLCEDMYHRYTSAISLKLITVSRRFSGHCLPGLYCIEDALRILRVIDF
jgi:hypothetical protein